ncbi:hypothetical protein NQ315_005751 [Exocentrus adspersus]|uniref:Tyr recombinase domain-containing protein n=1 Tax=Exocentrus adspersus TaxID=1586481 RepID=A0AAV8VEK5_9CUCU|nr:hypothetical protein NQ315_005751 [Exocentrus adspersus]
MEIGEMDTEKALLAYFFDQSKKYKSSSLWCMYPKLKCMLRIKNDIDISRFSKLTAFFKNRSVGYLPEKSPVFSKEQLMDFLLHAPDGKYLLMKLPFLVYLVLVDVWNFIIYVLLMLMKKAPFLWFITFTILNTDDSAVNYTDIIKKYMHLRPKHVKIQKFFLFYNAGKCTCNPVGINTFGQIPRNIAKYLNIPNADQYTGHSFWRTSATILANSGADIRTL